ncbi:hypothetical protein LTS08_004845 [Lithohypha guttulata]|uniref:NmrA-like domain-containing protein n=1 Tax=Lithohypha guttulata TaxID=1690604 RepID=A0AAN7YC40_9EURO|nr:hypothetical protein LTR05_002312 [Lithohypha guttulata]KAK5101238.1 hypothetical protein LTS08_004845 [Lithohypha guttulata]
MASQPLIAIVGATGAQGSSVLSTYLNTTSWRIRALTRSVSSSKAKALTERSSRIEVAEANLNDIASLRKAFEGAIAIFGVTDFWTLISDESNKAKVKDGQSFAEWGAEMEVQQGKNIFEAANQVSSLKRLVFSSLTDITKWSGGKYTYALHFDSKAIALKHAEEHFPNVYAKTSILVAGAYLENFKQNPFFKPKLEGEALIFNSFGTGNRPWPFIAAEEDTGSIVKALIELPAGLRVAAHRELKVMSDVVQLIGKAAGYEVRLEQQEFPLPDDLKKDLANIFGFVNEFGYWGNDPSIKQPEELGVELRLGSIEDWVKAQDWSKELNG